MAPYQAQKCRSASSGVRTDFTQMGPALLNERGRKVPGKWDPPPIYDPQGRASPHAMAWGSSGKRTHMTALAGRPKPTIPFSRAQSSSPKLPQVP